ncbi:MAG: ABC transporter ATP-binding protein [Eubacterium sp.]|nr:ABC transporter ATP-binding protein [Eubacterium sp.]
MSKQNNQKKEKGAFGRLLLYMKPWWGILAAVLVLSLTGAILNVLAPGFIADITNYIEEGINGEMDAEKIWTTAMIAFAILGGSFLCNFIQTMLTPVMSMRTAQKMRRDINEKANKIPLNYFDTNPEGEVLSTMTNDVDTVSQSFANTLPSMIVAVCTILGAFVMMFTMNWILAITTIVASLVGVTISAIILKKSSPLFSMNQNRLAGLNSAVNEDIKGHLVIKSFGAEREVTESFLALNDELYSSTWKSQFATSVLMPVSSFSSNLGYVVVCIVGALLVMKGQTDVGTIVAFISYVKMFSDQVSTVTQSVGNIQPALAGAKRIFTMLENEEMTDEGHTSVDEKKVTGQVSFDHIKFGYVKDHIIINDFSLDVKPGQKVAIVGPTGAGKSTIINLLTRFYELNSGDIRINGTSIYDMPRETLHDLISIVLQDTWTFQASIRDNIIYSKEGVTDELFKKTVDDAGLTEFIRTAPDGADTLIREEGDISSGQKQLITIARAMIKNAPILILDEATSSVDTRTELLIQKALDTLMEGRTSFVIAHRLSTIKNADVILVLKDGDVLETGTHDELMAKKGFYADLYMSQFDNGEGDVA